MIKMQSRLANTKKAGIRDVKEIILISIVFFILFVFSVKLMDMSREKSREAACRSSVLASWTGNNAKKVSDTRLNCKTNYVLISRDAIVMNGKKIKSLKCLHSSLGRCSEEDANRIVMKVIADEMAKCWNKFLEGRIDYSKVAVGVDHLCFVCTQINIEELPSGSISFDELKSFLKSEKFGDTGTYYDYLYGELDRDFSSSKIDWKGVLAQGVTNQLLSAFFKEVGSYVKGLFSKSDYKLESGKTYYIVFYARKAGFPISDYLAFIAIKPADKMIGFCEHLY